MRFVPARFALIADGDDAAKQVSLFRSVRAKIDLELRPTVLTLVVYPTSRFRICFPDKVRAA